MQRFAAAAVGQGLYYEARWDGWGCCARWGGVANEGVPSDFGIDPRSVSGRRNYSGHLLPENRFTKESRVSSKNKNRKNPLRVMQNVSDETLMLWPSENP